VIFLLGGTAFADPTYSIYSNPPLADGGTLRYGLNDLGSYVGWTYSGGTYFGFWNAADGNTTAIAPPAALNTHPTGINNNDLIVGYFSDASGTHAFMDAGGVYTTLNAPGAVSTYAYGVNNKGQVVGYYVDAKGLTHGFIESAGVFTTIDVPNAIATYGLSINQDGEIVGSYFDGAEVRGFIYHDGTFEYLDYPKAAVTWLTGISEDGTIVGWSQSCDQCLADPFVKTLMGPITPYWYAGGQGYQLTGVNDSGGNTGSGNPYLREPHNEQPLAPPAAIPEPGTTVLVGAGALVLLLARCFGKKQ
jgi:probable HAF family extracellular repeat protein